MEVIYLLIAFGMIVALLFLGAFFWAVKNGQFDDTYTPAIRMLLDDDKPVIEKKNGNEKIVNNKSQTKEK